MPAKERRSGQLVTEEATAGVRNKRHTIIHNDDEESDKPHMADGVLGLASNCHGRMEFKGIREWKRHVLWGSRRQAGRIWVP